jgi:hypothetical protein
VSDTNAAALDLIPETAWTPAYDADGQVRDGAWVAQATGVLDLAGWPDGMRVIVRKQRPHPGAQLRLTDRDRLRITAFATNTTRGQLPDLELRHRRRARCQDRIRVAKDTGLQNLPLHGFDQNQIWSAIVQLAMVLTTWIRCSPCTAMPRGGGNPNNCGYDCSRSPHASHVTPAEPGSASPHMPHGPSYSPWLWLDSNQPDQHESIQPSRKDQEPGGGTRQNPPDRATPHTPTPEIEFNKPIRKPSGHHARPEKDPG